MVLLKSTLDRIDQHNFYKRGDTYHYKDQK
jgi:hypothetical protein